MVVCLSYFSIWPKKLNYCNTSEICSTGILDAKEPYCQRANKQLGQPCAGDDACADIDTMACTNLGLDLYTCQCKKGYKLDGDFCVINPKYKKIDVIIINNQDDENDRNLFSTISGPDEKLKLDNGGSGLSLFIVILIVGVLLTVSGGVGGFCYYQK